MRPKPGLSSTTRLAISATVTATAALMLLPPVVSFSSSSSSSSSSSLPLLATRIRTTGGLAHADDLFHTRTDARGSMPCHHLHHYRHHHHRQVQLRRQRGRIRPSSRQGLFARSTAVGASSSSSMDHDNDEEDKDVHSSSSSSNHSPSPSQDVRMDQETFLRRELTRIESLEDILEEIDDYCAIDGNCEEIDDKDGTDDDEDGEEAEKDLDDLDELFSLLQETDAVVIEDDEVVDNDVLVAMTVAILDDDDEEDEGGMYFDGDTTGIIVSNEDVDSDPRLLQKAALALEKALAQGVVPANAGVATDALPGDFGFDPLHMAEKDYIHQAQYRFLSALPGGNPNNDPSPAPRPSALVLRDYREAEIRHGRLACLAVIIWPLQEKLDRLLLDDDQIGPILWGPVTLPFFPLLMTLVMMLLGYLDIYAKSIQEEEEIGDAFLPGDCFWDPLRILQGAPPLMKRNMQERELFNCRMAMLAFAAFCFEELTSHQAVIDIPSNALLFEPLYQVSFVQEWLDQQFS